MKVTFIPTAIGALGTVSEGLIKGRGDLEIRGRVGTIKTTGLLILIDYYRPEYWRLEGTCCHSNSSERPSSNVDVKNSQGVNNNKLTIMPIVIGALGTVTKGLIQKLRD